MRPRLSEASERRFWREVESVYDASRLKECRRLIQHGDVSVYRHCVAVAYLSCCLEESMHIPVDEPAMVRAALLHDYFLYDWHEKDPSHRLHGFTHPACALANAMQDFPLTGEEQNIILRHMFPLTPIPPAHREGWIVCLADKICSLWETAHLNSDTYGREPLRFRRAPHTT